MSPGSDPQNADATRAARPGGVVPGTGWRGPGEATTTLLLRHGETPLSAERRFAGRGDIPLTGRGMQQAAAAAARLAARGDVAAVISSPLRRALSTAQAVAEATGAALETDDDLAETDFGDWEGMSFRAAGARWPAEMEAWLADAEAAPPGGESFAAVAQRVLAALDRLLADHGGQTVVVVSHVTPVKTVICRALLAPPAAMFRMNLDVASLSEVSWFSDGAAVLRSLNDVAHLTGEWTHSEGEKSPGSLAER